MFKGFFVVTLFILLECCWFCSASCDSFEVRYVESSALSANGQYMVQLDIQGGTPPYKFIEEGLVEDSAGCRAQANRSLVFLGVTLSTHLPRCHGDGSGSIVADVAGGEAPYSFSWDSPNDFSASSFLNNPTDGRHCLYVRDSTMRTGRNCVVFSQPAPLVVDRVEQKNVSCHNSADGLLRVHVVGGTPPLQYSWASPSSSPLVFSLDNTVRGKRGVYVVNVRDASGCSIEGTYRIYQPSALKIGLVGKKLSKETETEEEEEEWSVTWEGGMGPYETIWGGNDFQKVKGESRVHGETVRCKTGAIRGVAVRDGNGCEVGKQRIHADGVVGLEVGVEDVDKDDALWQECRTLHGEQVEEMRLKQMAKARRKSDGATCILVAVAAGNESLVSRLMDVSAPLHIGSKLRFR